VGLTFFIGNNMKLIDWDKVWEIFNEWFTQNDGKTCDKCWHRKINSPDWEDQKFKIEAIVQDFIDCNGANYIEILEKQKKREK
jgi:hypothetical protein